MRNTPRPATALPWLLVLAAVARASGQANPLISSLAWMAQVANGEKPKLSAAPLVQFETGNRYYKAMLDGMAENFKRSIARSSERSFSLHNVTSVKPITVSPGTTTQLSLVDLRIEGLDKPKISNIHVNKRTMKLHVTFYYKHIKVSGKCSSGHRSLGAQHEHQLLEASGWNVSWSANLVQMIGRDHFDTKRVYTSHSHKSASLPKDKDTNECLPSNHQDKLKLAMMDKIKSQIDARLVETMEGVLMRTDSAAPDDSGASFDSATAGSSVSHSKLARIKRAAQGAPKKPAAKPVAKPVAARKAVKPSAKPAKSEQARSARQVSAPKATEAGATKVAAAKTKPAARANPQPASSAKTVAAKPKAKAASAAPAVAPKKASVVKARAAEVKTKTREAVAPKQQQQQKKSAPLKQQSAAVKQSPKRANPVVAEAKSVAQPAKKQAAKKQPVAAPVPSAKKSSPAGPTPKSKPLAAKAAKAVAPKALKRVKRDTPCEEGDEADEFADQLLRFGSRIIKNMEPFALPNTTIELPDYDLKIFLWDGKGSRIHQYRRVKPAWVYCDNSTESLGLTLEVDELRATYKYRVISGYRLLFDGDLQAKMSPRLQLQFSQAKQRPDEEEEVQQRIEKIRLFRLGRVHVIIRGLGNLTQSLSMLINQYLNDNQEELQPTFRMVEGDAVRMANKMLERVTVPILGVV